MLLIKVAGEQTWENVQEVNFECSQFAWEDLLTGLRVCV